MRNQLPGSDVLTVTAFYKDIFDYITEKTVLRVNTVGGRSTISTYLNSDYGRVRGIEVEYKTRFGNWFRGGVARIILHRHRQEFHAQRKCRARPAGRT
ncbi:MAG: TonB-dependent receptor [Ignavibacteriales bacterium]|nr:TonB-dependent receptor [Ignavibacteriales bacterium]